MKVFVSEGENKRDGYHNCTLPELFNSVEDGEASVIECDDIFSSYKSEDIGILISVAKKVKIGGELIVVEPDVVGLLLSWYLHNDSTLEQVNDRIFSNGSINSVINVSHMTKLLEDNFDVSVNKFGGNIVIKGVRKS
jgi:hypothetical protein